MSEAAGRRSLRTGAARLLARLLHRPSADLAQLQVGLDLRAIDLTEGVRAALSVAVLVAADEWLRWPPMMEAALAAWLCCLCDQGGPVARRVAPVLTCAFVGAAITAGLGLARYAGDWVALPAATLVVFACSFARIYGQSAQTVGNLLAVTAVLALDHPLDPPSAVVAASAYACGGLWAALLTLVIWRVHPYLPARRAVADAYEALALMVGDLRDALRAPHPEEAAQDTVWERHARAHRRAVRDAIEAARAILMEMARSRGAAASRAAQSRLRLEVAEQVFGALIALTDRLEQGHKPADAAVAERVLRRLRVLLLVFSHAIVTDRMRPAPVIVRSLEAIAADVADLPEDHPVRPIYDAIVEHLRMALLVSVPANYLPADRQQTMPLRRRIGGPLRANLNLQSLALRHALRIALVAAPAFAVTLAWPGPYEHWLTITMLVVMQPYFALTWTRALERIGGTMLGGVLAALIALACHTPVELAVALVPTLIVALAVRRVSYGLFTLAITPLVVLLSELGQPGTSQWTLALMRALFTVLGGLIAVLGCFVLWPSWEPSRLGREVRAAIEAHRAYAAAELAFVLGEGSEEAADQARRAAGVSSNNLEASLSRALLEPGDRTRLDAALVIDSALRRMAGRLSAIQLDPALRHALSSEEWRAWRDWLDKSLRALVEGDPSLPPRPSALARQEREPVSRISRQVELMAGALARLGA
jgi:uncharacterized membrane protein YccC